MYKGSVPGRMASFWPIVENPEPSEDGPLALVRAVFVIAKRHWFKLLAWLITCVALAAVYAYTIPPSYTATATILLDPRRPASAPAQENAALPSLDMPRAEGELEVIRSERLLSQVFERLNLSQDPEFGFRQPDAAAAPERNRITARILEAFSSADRNADPAEVARQSAFANFASKVTVRRVGQSYVVEVSFTARSPTLARRVANATVSAYLLQSVSLKADAARNGAEFIQARINALTNQTNAAAAAVAGGTLPDIPMPDADARIIGAALQPLTPSAPRPKLIIAFGVVLGIIGSFFAVVAIHAFDRRIRTADTLTRTTGLPCLASVPQTKRLKGLSKLTEVDMRAIASSNPHDAFATAIRNLRTSINLAFASGEPNGNYAVAFVSWDRNAGCSLICSSLARILHCGGKPVTVIDTDIHVRGRSAGETADGVSLADLLTNGAHFDERSFQNVDGVGLLPARAKDAGTNYLADLGTPELAQIVSNRRQAGNVLIDMPPLCEIADAKAAAIRADAVVLVVAAGRTTIEEATEAVAALKSAGANVIGAVINRVK